MHRVERRVNDLLPSFVCFLCADRLCSNSGPLGLWVTPQPSAPTARVADAPPPRPAAAVQWSDGRIAACTYHGPVPSNPAKDSRLCHPRPGAVAHGRRETVPKRRRRRHDPPPPRPAATAAARSRPQSWRAGPNVSFWRPRLGSPLCTHHRCTVHPQTRQRSTFTSPAPPSP